MDENTIKFNFPLHYLVWCNKKEPLQRHLSTIAYASNVLEKKDPRGRTPLLLAVTLGNKACSSMLIKHGARLDTEDELGFTVFQEAIVGQNLKFCRYLNSKGNQQLFETMASLWQKLAKVDDFYVEIDLEFTTWVPFVGFFLPNDKISVFKSGNKIRIDDTLVSNDEEDCTGYSPWKRGHSSMIIEIEEHQVTYRDINHTRKEIFEIKYGTNNLPDLSSDEWTNLMSSEINSIELDISKVTVEPAKSGVLMFASERSELVNGYQCQVYSVSDLKVTHCCRIEHLSEEDKRQLKSAPVNAFLNVLGIRTRHEPRSAIDPPSSADKGDIRRAMHNPHRLTLLDYFNAPATGKQQKTSKDVGLGREMIIRSKKSGGRLWMSQQFPLSVNKHLLPVLQLMTAFFPYSKCFAQFVSAKLPEGFPVKFEVSVFQALRAQVTFSNAFASIATVPGVRTGVKKHSCLVDQSLFDLPDVALGYSNVDW